MTDYEKELKAKRQQDTIEELETEIESLSKKNKLRAIVFVVSVLSSVCGFALLRWTYWDYSEILIWSSCLVLIASLSAMIFGYHKKNTVTEDLKTVKQDVDEYQKQIKIRELSTAKPVPLDKATPEQIENMIKAAQNNPKCPICGSRNTAKISTLNRVVSVSTLGLASSKIGKSYQCNNCKSKW